MCKGDVRLGLALVSNVVSCKMMQCLVAILRKILFQQRERAREKRHKEWNQHNTSTRKHVRTSRSLSLSFSPFLSLIRRHYGLVSSPPLSLSLSVSISWNISIQRRAIRHFIIMSHRHNNLIGHQRDMYTHTRRLFFFVSHSHTHTLAL